ncbi:MAG: phage tail protein [Paracraurococcus sp.]
MRQPGFQHLTGRAMWRRCDHVATRIEGMPARVTLATAASVTRARPPQPAAWRAAMGGAALFDCPPDLCDGAAVVLGDPAHGLSVLRDGAWVALPLPPARPAPAGPLDFAPVHAPAAAPPPRAVARDPAERLWLLEAHAVRLLGHDLRVAAVLRLPADAKPVALACTAWGLVVADTARPRLLVQAWGGEWQALALPSRPRALAGDARFATAVVVLAGRRIGVLHGPSAPAIHRLPALHAPLQAVMLAEDRVLIADPAGPPGGPQVTPLTEFRLLPEGPEAERGFAVRGFDGRALWRDAAGAVFASTAKGARAVYLAEPALATAGVVESFALDSGVFACVWHRVFVDACLPPGTGVELEARTADTLPPRDLWRGPRPPADLAAAVPADPAWPPLGSLTEEEAVGWVPVGLLDRRPAYADTPDPPFGAAIASEDPLPPTARGAQDPPPAAMVTLEGVLKAPPGRWLWLRLRLSGTTRRAPQVFALRATAPRPSLLDLLPAYWRGDPVAAEATDRALALFEGFVTETDARITALRQLLSAHTAPAEALDWLASFLALTFDQRVAEPVRRSLLAEIATLWRQRGTVPGLTRLLSILAQAPVQLIEGFRLRRENAPVIGTAEWGVLGPGLQLGADEGPEAVPAEPWEVALESAQAALLLRRATTRAEGGTPCPEAEPPEPLDPDPVIAFHRRHAHRFTVVVPACRTADLAAVLDLAVETNKPAHTLHTLCWLDAGFRLGQGSLVGIARIGPRPEFAPAILDAPLGAGRILGRAVPEDRWRIGATPIPHHRTPPA